MTLQFVLFVVDEDEKMYMNNWSLKLNIIKYVHYDPANSVSTHSNTGMNATNTGMPLFFRYKFMLPKRDLIQILRSPTKLHHLPPPTMTKKCWQVAIVNQSKL